MAISTNGTVIARLAGGLYNTQMSNATYLEVAAQDPSTLANTLYSRDFAKSTDLSVATTLLANLGLAGQAGLDAWVAAQLTAAGAANKGAKIVSLLNDFAGLSADATWGSYATTFNDKIDAALVLSQTTGNKGGTFSAAGAASGKEFTLTASIDNIVGTALNDTFYATHATLGSNDELNGGLGADVLVITDTGTNPWTATSALTVNGIETVRIQNMNGTGATGTSAVTEKADIVFTSLGANQTLTIAGRVITAGSSGAAAKDVATAFSSGSTTGGATVSGTLADFTIAASPTNVNAVVATSSTASSNVSDITASGTAFTGIATVNQNTTLTITNAATNANNDVTTFTYNGVTVTAAAASADTVASKAAAVAAAINAYAGSTIASSGTSAVVTISSPTPISLAGFASTGDTYAYALASSHSAAVAPAAPAITITQGSAESATSYTQAGVDTFAAGKFVGATDFVNQKSTSGLKVTGLVTGQNFTVQGDGIATLGSNEATYTTVASPSITIQGGGTSGALTLSGTSTTAATINVKDAPLTTTGTMGTTTVGAASVFNDATSTTGTLTINTSASNFTTGTLTTKASKIVAAGNGSVTFGSTTTPAAIVDTNLAEVDASGLTGATGLYMRAPTSLLKFTGGQGNDTFVTGALSADAVVDAGAGTGDTLILNATTDVDTVLEGAQYRNFETLRLAGKDYDASLIAGITAIQIIGTSGSSSAVSNLSAAQAGNLTYRNAGNAATTATLSLATSVGTSDVLSLKLGGTATTTDAAANITTALTINGFETVNLTAVPGSTASAGASQISTIAAFAADSMTALNLKGSSFALSDIATNVAKKITIDGSALTGDKASTVATTVGFTTVGAPVSGSTIIGSNFNDSFTVSAEGLTVNGGSGDDTFLVTSADPEAILTADGTTDLVLSGGTNNTVGTTSGGDTLRVLSTTATDATDLTDNHFTFVSGMDRLTLSNTGSLTLTTGAAFNAAFAQGAVITTGTLADTKTVNIQAGLSSVNMNVTIDAISLVANGAGEDLTVVTGSGADNVTITGDATYIGGTGDGGTITVSTKAGDDKISVTVGTLTAQTTSQAIVITGGTGADEITKVGVNGSNETSVAIYNVANGDSTIAARDKIIGFDMAVTAGTIHGDQINFDGTGAVSAFSASSDYGVIRSHAISNGVVTFDDVDGGVVTALVINSANLADVVGYLNLNVANLGTVGFLYDSNNDGGNDSSMIYNNDVVVDGYSLVELVAVTVVGLSATVTTATDGYVIIS